VFSITIQNEKAFYIFPFLFVIHTVEKLKEQGKTIAFIGDGINNAPYLPFQM